MWLINLIFKDKSKIKREELKSRMNCIIAKDSLRAKTTEIVKQDRVLQEEDKTVIKTIRKIVAHVVEPIRICIKKFKNIRRIQIKGEDDCNDGING